jgi:uncharacterized protein
VHGFDHIQRVLALAERLAQAEGADLEIVRAAALLHDASPADTSPMETPAGQESAHRADHHLDSARFASRVLTDLGWTEIRIEAVLHCIRAHRFRDDREAPVTLEAQVLFDADKLDAIGAVGAARALAYAAAHGSPLYAPVSQSFLADGQLEEGEPHSAYHEYIFKLRHLKERMFTGTGRQLAEERNAFMAAYFERLVEEWHGSS